MKGEKQRVLHYVFQLLSPSIASLFGEKITWMNQL